MPGITVGVDGSGHSQRALEWAIKEAGIRNTALTVLAVHQVAGNHWSGNPMTFPEDAPLQEKTRQQAQEVVQKAVDEAGEPKPASVTVRAVSGIAAQELLKASEDSDMIVIGSRGGGGFARLMLGSVSHQVVGHASSPVVVIPGEK
jgi:nucleotide-binding universal stress UspA family protein